MHWISPALRLIPWVALLLLALGCKGSHGDTLERLVSIRPECHDVVASTPVIDIHAHTFNARSLPLVELAKLHAERADGAWRLLFLDVWSRSLPQEAKLFYAVVRDEVGAQLREEMFGEQADEILDSEGPDDRETVIYWRLSKETPHILGLVRLFGFLSRTDIRRFVDVLRTDADEMEARYHRTFRDEVDLTVSHMMDLAPVYNEVPDGRMQLEFVTQQIPAMQRAQAEPASRMIYFVAYNPFRHDHLDIVKDAVLNKGAWGVKVYPPSGYRPTENRTPSRPFWRVARAQHDRRYDPVRGGVSAQELDRRLAQLLSWSEEKNVPVFAHCGTGEFEAQKGYGRRMAHPKYWKQYLEGHGCPPGKCQLRLCLGHAGGSVYWFGTSGRRGDEEWGELVVELCRAYPNVYAEFGASGEIFERPNRAFFVERLLELTSSDALIDDGKYPVMKKLMYGSDWFMPGSHDLGYTYLRFFRQALLYPELEDTAYRDFFFSNASRYLNLEGRASADPVTQEGPVLPAPIALRVSELREDALAEPSGPEGQ